jgi:hypothetical protein
MEPKPKPPTSEPQTAAQINAPHVGHCELHPRRFESGVQQLGDEILKETVVRLERKQFLISARRNRNGEFIRIDEQRFVHNAHAPNRIIIPKEGLAKFVEQFTAAMKELDGK